MKLSDSCPYEFPCLMKGKKESVWGNRVFLMAVNEVDKPVPFVNAIVVKVLGKHRGYPSVIDSIGDNYGFEENNIMEEFEPYHDQVIIHAEDMELNLI